MLFPISIWGGGLVLWLGAKSTKVPVTAGLLHGILNKPPLYDSYVDTLIEKKNFDSLDTW